MLCHCTKLVPHTLILSCHEDEIKECKMCFITTPIHIFSIIIYCVNAKLIIVVKVGNYMQSTLGKTLRSIRHSKQMSLTELADEHLSKSQISRFERGESEISCARLINILDKLHVSMNEFILLNQQNPNCKPSFTKLVEHIRKEYSEHRFDNIKVLLTDPKDYTINTLERTMIKSIMYDVDNSIKPSMQELAHLRDYLFKVEGWGYFEIVLLGNCIRTIGYTYFFQLIKEILSYNIYSDVDKTNKRLVTQLAINCLILSIDEAKFTNCHYLIREITPLLATELNYYEQTVFLYAKGYLEFKLQKKRRGIEKMKQAILIFEFLGENKFKKQYEEHYSKLVAKK